jgi:hypothetical protein
MDFLHDFLLNVWGAGGERRWGEDERRRYYGYRGARATGVGP